MSVGLPHLKTEIVVQVTGSMFLDHETQRSGLFADPFRGCRFGVPAVVSFGRVLLQTLVFGLTGAVSWPPGEPGRWSGRQGAHEAFGKLLAHHEHRREESSQHLQTLQGGGILASVHQHFPLSQFFRDLRDDLVLIL